MQQGHDISVDVSGLISDAKVVGASENIRHGRGRMLIKRIHARLVENDKGTHRMAFWEMTPIRSEPNPQVEGDHVDYPGTSGPLIDDGTKPNPPGSNCALKVNFDGPGGRAAGSNIKEAILALFGKRDGQMSKEEVNETWIDLSRQRPLRAGEIERLDPATGQPIYAKKDKLDNPACGMVIDYFTMPKKKSKPNDKGAYITKIIWQCVDPPGQGENSFDKVAARRAEIMRQMESEEEEETATTPPPPNGFNGAPTHAGFNGQPQVPQGFVPPPGYPQMPPQGFTPQVPPGYPQQPQMPAQGFAPPQGYPQMPPGFAPPQQPQMPQGFQPPPVAAPPAAPVAPQAPPTVATPFAPQKPWEAMPGNQGPTPDTRWFWSNPAFGGDNSVKNEAQLRAGR